MGLVVGAPGVVGRAWQGERGERGTALALWDRGHGAEGTAVPVGGEEALGARASWIGRGGVRCREKARELVNPSCRVVCRSCAGHAGVWVVVCAPVP